MTSKWIQSAPAASTEFTSAPKRAKSADKSEGEMIIVIVTPSSHAARRANPLIRFLDALSFLFRHLRHRLGQSVGHQFIRMMAAHLPPIGLGHFLISDAGVDFQLRVAFRQRPSARAMAARAGGGAARAWPPPQRGPHVGKFEAGHAQPLRHPRQYRPR